MSHPPLTPSAKSRKITLHHLQRMKESQQKIVALTAYDAITARLIDNICDVILVGDSLGMVHYGDKSTLSVGLPTMIRHGKAVANACQHALVVVDMPFASYQKSPQQAFANAAKIMQQTGADAVKLEGGEVMAETIHFLTQRGIAVMGHIGLMPQSVSAMGGFRVQGRADESKTQILADAAAISKAGAFAIVLEGIVPSLAKPITENSAVPTIGIGASADCDGQILVSEDMLGLTENPPKFVRRYGDLAAHISAAASRYAEDVRNQTFPAAAECYKE